MLTESKKDYRLFEILSSEEKMELYLKSHGKDVKKINPIIWNIHFNIPELKRMAVLNKYVGELLQKQKTLYNFLPEHMIQARLYDLLRVPYTMVMKKNKKEFSIKLTRNSNHHVITLKKYYNRKAKAPKRSNLEQFDFMVEKNSVKMSFSCFRRIQKEKKLHLAEPLSSPLVIDNEKGNEPVSTAVAGRYENRSKYDDQSPVIKLPVRFPRKCKSTSLFNVDMISVPTASADRKTNIIEQSPKAVTVEKQTVLNQDVIISTATMFSDNSPICKSIPNSQKQMHSEKMSPNRDKKKTDTRKKQSSPYSTSNRSNISDELASSTKSPTYLGDQHNLIQQQFIEQPTETVTSPYSTSNCSDVINEFVSPVNSCTYLKDKLETKQPSYIEQSHKGITNNKQSPSISNVITSPDLSGIGPACEAIPNSQERIYHEEIFPKSDRKNGVTKRHEMSPYPTSNCSDVSDKFRSPVNDPAHATNKHNLIEKSPAVVITDKPILSIQDVASPIFSKRYGKRKPITNSQKRVYYEEISPKRVEKNKTVTSSYSDTSYEFSSPLRGFTHLKGKPNFIQHRCIEHPSITVTNNEENFSPTDVIISPNFSKSLAREATSNSQKRIYHQEMSPKSDEKNTAVTSSYSDTSYEFSSPLRGSTYLKGKPNFIQHRRIKHPPVSVSNDREILSPSDVNVSPNFSKRSLTREAIPNSQEWIYSKKVQAKYDKKNKIRRKKQISLSSSSSRPNVSNRSEDEFVSPIENSASRSDLKKFINGSISKLKNKENLMPEKNEIKTRNRKLRSILNSLKKSDVPVKSHDISPRAKKIDMIYDYFSADDHGLVNRYDKSKPVSIKRRTTPERNNLTNSSKNKYINSSSNKKSNYNLRIKTAKPKVNSNRDAIERAVNKNPVRSEDEKVNNSNNNDEDVYMLGRNEDLNGDMNKKKFLSGKTKRVIQSKNMRKKYNKSKINLNKSVSKHINKRIWHDDSDYESSSGSKKDDVLPEKLDCYGIEIKQKSSGYISGQQSDVYNSDFSIDRLFQDVSNWKKSTPSENNFETSKKRNKMLDNILGLPFLSETSAEDSPEIMCNENALSLFSDENSTVERTNMFESNSATRIRSQQNQLPTQQVNRSQSSISSQQRQQLALSERNKNHFVATVRNESNDYNGTLDKDKVEEISSLFIDYDSENETATPESTKSSLNNYEEIISAIKFREGLNSEVDFEIYKVGEMAKKQRSRNKETFSNSTVHPQKKQISSQQEMKLPNYKEQQWDSLPDSLESSLTSADEKLDLVRQKMLSVYGWCSSE